MSKQEKKQGWEESDKILGIIAIILVGGFFFFMGSKYSEISFDSDEIPIGMTEGTISKQCDDLRRDYRVFKEFMGVGDVLTEQQIDEISYRDYTYYTRLQVQLDTLNCTLEPDT